MLVESKGACMVESLLTITLMFCTNKHQTEVFALKLRTAP